ncbi:hypothetical protein BDK51DRAFT_31178 [Blyttiomyces helicus]|uniref:SH3 domain-containing protein n=1 Tax=Blyttiomyces helicus TaxID=388810 RepID=A0A4P9WEQ4_9FUNG|nr:hypothetical protein BDK51DRAFT_31178 [Blyttiomyces helicus]|eukprot:RKO91084.1 hypothetical protein BDK51DRAFT_31178 [Blyttiomyces helicus]
MHTLLSFIPAAFFVGAATAQSTPPRFSGVLAAGPACLVMFGGGVGPDWSNVTPALAQLGSLIISGVVTVDYTHQSTSLVSTVDSEHRLTAKGQACAASGSLLGYVLQNFVSSLTGTYVAPTLGVFNMTSDQWLPTGPNLTAVPVQPGQSDSTNLPAAAVPRLEFSAMAIVGNTAWLFGGYTPDVHPGFSNATFALTLDPTSLEAVSSQVELVTTTVAPISRWEHCMTPLGSDSFLLYGGFASSALSDTWIFSTSQRTWTELTPSVFPGARWNAACATTSNNTAFLFGGDDGTGPNGLGTRNDLWSFNAKAGTWVNIVTTGTPPTPRTYASMAAIGSDWLVVSGPTSTAVPTAVTASSSSSSTGAIAGGIAGGVVVIAAASFFLWRRAGTTPVLVPKHSSSAEDLTSAEPQVALDILDSLPPAYDGAAMAPGRLDSSIKPKDMGRVYRGLCKFTPTNGDEIPCKLGDEIVVEEVFRDGWAKVINGIFFWKQCCRLLTVTVASTPTTITALASCAPTPTTVAAPTPTTITVIATCAPNTITVTTGSTHNTTSTTTATMPPTLTTSTLARTMTIPATTTHLNSTSTATPSTMSTRLLAVVPVIKSTRTATSTLTLSATTPATPTTTPTTSNSAPTTPALSNISLSNTPAPAPMTIIRYATLQALTPASIPTPPPVTVIRYSTLTAPTIVVTEVAQADDRSASSGSPNRKLVLPLAIIGAAAVLAVLSLLVIIRRRRHRTAKDSAAGRHVDAMLALPPDYATVAHEPSWAEVAPARVGKMTEDVETAGASSSSGGQGGGERKEKWIGGGDGTL